MIDARDLAVVGDTLYVSDGYDSRASDDHPIYVYTLGNAVKPTPAFTWTGPSDPLTVQFTSTGQPTPGSTSPAPRFTWTFGDGAASTLPNPSHHYAAPGTKTVTLTVTNAAGFTSVTHAVVVPAAPVIKPGIGGVTEGNTGTVTLNVPVTLSHASSTNVTVHFATVDTGAAGIATAGVDYVPTSGTLTFTPGQTSKTVPITVIGDTLREPPLLYGEWILVSFSNATGAPRSTPPSSGSVWGSSATTTDRRPSLAAPAMAWRSVVPGRTVARVGRPEVSAQLRLLGPVELVLDDEPLKIGGERQRAVLACLAVHSRSTVLTEALIDAVWGDAAPTSVDKSLTTLLARLRKPLVRCGGTIEHTGAGYRLTMPDDAIDVLCFDQLVAAARADAATGRHEAAVGRLRARWSSGGERPWPTWPMRRLSRPRRRTCRRSASRRRTPSSRR